MSYMRVIPRDLFNEANLLKCYGRLWILLDETRGHNARLGTGDSGPDDHSGAAFEIYQSPDDGALTILNVPFRIGGALYRLYRPLNSRAEWPLWCERMGEEFDCDPVEVFTDDGWLSADFQKLIMVPPGIYRRGREDYAEIYRLANDPEQKPAIVGEDEFNEMLGCVPPIYVDGLSGFLVGEALTRGPDGVVYAHYYRSRDGLYCARYHLKKGR